MTTTTHTTEGTMTTKTRPTIEQAEQMVRDAGYACCEGASWETEEHVYAFSRASVPGTMGHPRLTVHYSAIAGTLEIG